MTPKAKAKATTTKRMTALAGIKLPKPGQCRTREPDVRAQIAADLEPAGFFEMTWVTNLASCETAMEVTRAQIAAVEGRQIQAAYDHFCDAELVRLKGPPPRDWDIDAPKTPAPLPDSQFSDEEWSRLHSYAQNGFEADWKKSLLGEPMFCILLARAGNYYREQLQLLKTELREETKERDRLFNLIERHRRLARQEARADAEEGRRDEMFRMVKTRHAAELRPAGAGTELQIVGPVSVIDASSLADRPIIEAAARTVGSNSHEPGAPFAGDS